ncbi:DEAD/DEAH box helicase [Paucilactobacillus nenjiangensis]|uniref:DNA/RNA helicase n=1 Tax=Paucilactobacillus nenjiangensis TaxID=1296540 RepID=A0A5P1X5N3_9LACO|nr:helicase-related protein [Paucilactobacillus nenjiangensis]QER67989.1 DNA/RNA helicase [Paucilactobacillus nenjiangensis]
MDRNLLFGRRIVDNCNQQTKYPNDVIISPSINQSQKPWRCGRCNSVIEPLQTQLPGENYYCANCIMLGRNSTLTQFYHLPEENRFELQTQPLTWTGQLSKLQEECSQQVTECLQQHQRHLLWAVTGAGKTEMLFNAISEALKRNERVAIASPRVDVCIELFPRIQSAFANTEMCLLHGKQTDPYRYTQLTICTTHQLLKFYHAFDNLIVDEVDSFPYADNPQLYFATEQAVKKEGGILYLTATPGKKLLARAKRGELGISYLPLRYHGHLLPEIKIKLVPNWQLKIKKKQLPPSLIRAMKERIAKQQRFLLFVPRIADLPLIKIAIERKISVVRCVTVHAADPQRLEKVQAMREEKIMFLVTTSILERGVTFPGIDVFVLGAEDDVFSDSALVQIAGRAGRSTDRPTGDVIFWIGQYAQNVRSAIHQIKFVNQKGRVIQREMHDL